MDIQEQSDLIDRFLHLTSEPFDDWLWDGKELSIILKEETIEKYYFDDLKPLIHEFK